MYAFIATVLAEIGPRESCTAAEARLGSHLTELWRGQGHRAHSEAFTCHPTAFLGVIPIAALLYLGAAGLYWSVPWASALLAVAALVVTVVEVLRYRELLDPLFPEATGHNAIGVISPRGEVRQRIVVSAHQDSAYEFNLWYFLRAAAIPVMIIGFLAPLVPLVGALVAGVDGDSAWVDRLGWLSLGLYPVVGLNLFFHTYTVVPGAMDDLAGVAVLVGLGQALADDEHRPAHTEVVLLGAAAEEAGLRGAKRYAAAHTADHSAVPTFGIFVDGVYDERYLTVISRELFTGAVHDSGLVRLARDVAAARDQPMKQTIIPLGASDATAFSLAGVPSVCLLCQDTSRLVPNYHTRLDTIEHVRPESLAVMLDIVADMITRLDADSAVPK
jgi:hypothetical protein